MVKWEYMTVWIKWESNEQVSGEINRYGATGYELVNFIHLGGKKFAFVFKRPVGAGSASS